MTQNAANRSRENLNASASQNQGASVRALLDDALSKLLSADDNGNLDQDLYTQLRNSDETTLRSRVRDAMRTRLDADGEDRFSGVTNEDVEKVDGRLIRARFLLIWSELESERSEVFSALRTLARPSFFTDEHTRRLKKAIDAIPRSRLLDFKRSEEKGRAFIERTLSVVIPEESSNSVDNFLADYWLTKDFAGNEAEQKELDRLLYRRLSRQHMTAEQNVSLAQFIAKISDPQTKKRMFCELIPTMRIDALDEAGLLSETQKKDLLEKYIRTVIAKDGGANTFDAAHQQEYIALIKSQFAEDIYELPIPTSLVLDGSTDTLVQALTTNKSEVSAKMLKNFQGTIDAGTIAWTENRNTGIQLESDSQGKFHQSFVDFMAKNPNKPGGKGRCFQNPNDAHKMKAGAYIIGKVRGEGGVLKEAVYLKIAATDVPVNGGPQGNRSDGSNIGVTTEDFTLRKSVQMAGSVQMRQNQSYENLYRLFSMAEIEIVSPEEMEQRQKGEGGDPSNRIDIAPVAPDHVQTLPQLQGLLDMDIDKVGKDFPLEAGLVFEQQEQRWSSGSDFTKENPVMWRIDSIRWDMIHITDWEGGNPESLSLTEFAQASKENRMRRMWKFSTLADFKNSAMKAFSDEKYPQIELKNGKLYVKKPDGKLYKIESFLDKDSNPENEIIIESAKDGSVTFAHITEPGQKEDKKNGTKAEKPKGVKHENVPYELLFIYLRNYGVNKPKIAAKDIDHEHDHDHDHDHEPHLHGGFWSWYLSQPSIGGLIRSFGAGKHAIEHWLEERNEIEMLKVMDKWGGAMPDFMRHHIEHELTTKSSGRIDSIAEHIKKMPPVEVRNEVIHILHNKNASFEHVHAALVVAASKGGGQLYWEELKGLQGEWLYFRALCRVYRLPYEHMKKMCLEKAGAINQENPTEESAIEYFFKTIQGLKWGDGTHQDSKMMKSTRTMPADMIGKYLQALHEGREKAIEGGKKNATQRLAGSDRSELAWQKIYSNEFSMVLGMLPTIASKGMDPKLNGPWFGMVMSGAISDAFSDTANKLKNIAEDDGHTFHAVAFMRSPDTAAIYQNTVRSIAVHLGIDTAPLDTMAAIRGGDYGWEHDVQKRSKMKTEAFKGIRAFWDKNYDKIHPYLQLKNDFIAKNQSNPAFSAYHRYLVGDGSEQNEGIWWYKDMKQLTEFSKRARGTGMYIHNPGKLSSDLQLCTIHPNNGSMEEESYVKIWKPSILWRLDRIREDLKDDDFSSGATEEQKVKERQEKFREVYSSIIKYLQGENRRIANFEHQDYMDDLKDRGFNIYTNARYGTPAFDQAADAAFERFMRRERGPEKDDHTASLMDNVRAHIADASNDSQFRQAA